jgi:hypothetical protein
MYNPFAFVDRTINEKPKKQETLRILSSVYPAVRLSYNEQSNFIHRELELMQQKKKFQPKHN